MGFKEKVRQWNQRAQAAAFMAELRSLGFLVNPQQNRISQLGLTTAGQFGPLAGARMTVQRGGSQSRVTGTRVAAGAVLAGPVGAVIGAMVRKDKSKIYIDVTCEDGQTFSSERPADQFGKAQRVANQFNTMRWVDSRS